MRSKKVAILQIIALLHIKILTQYGTLTWDVYYALTTWFLQAYNDICTHTPHTHNVRSNSVFKITSSELNCSYMALFVKISSKLGKANLNIPWICLLCQAHFPEGNVFQVHEEGISRPLEQHLQQLPIYLPKWQRSSASA